MPIIGLSTQDLKIHHYSCSCCGTDSPKQLQIEPRSQITLDMCQYCGFIYRANWLSKEASDNFYKKKHKTDPNIFYYQKEWYKYSLIHLNGPKEVQTTDSRYLDIGSGLGKNMELMPNKFKVGLELALPYYKYSRFELKQDTRNSYDLVDGGFNLVTIFQAIQQIPNLGHFLIKLREHMASDGKLFIAVPILDNMTADFIRERFPLEYCSFFTEKSIINILQSSGFEIVKYEKIVKEFLITCKPGKQELIKRLFDETYQKYVITLQCIDHFMKKEPVEIKKLNPEILDAWVMEAQPNIQDFHYMFKFADEILKNFNDSAIANVVAGQFYMQQRIYDKAIFCLEKGVSKMWTFDTFFSLATCYYDSGIFDESIRCFKKVWEIFPLFNQRGHYDEKQDLIKIIAGIYSRYEA